jgi:hypothetical protein
MKDQIPDSRLYVHRQCGETTEVDGGDFRNMASPVPGMIKTICCKCGKAFPVSEFQWVDTGEGIAAYYERHLARVPALPRLLCSRQFSTLILLIGFLSGIALGGWCWSVLGIVWGIVVGVVSSLVGAIGSLVIWDAVTARILSRSLGVPDVRCLK